MVRRLYEGNNDDNDGDEWQHLPSSFNSAKSMPFQFLVELILSVLEPVFFSSVQLY
jgi:hypothetical protein